MSRSSKKIHITNNSKLSRGRSENKRLPKAIYSDQSVSVTESVVLYKLVFHSRKAILLTFLLCLSFLWQPIDYAYADTDAEAQSESVVEVDKAPEVSVEIAEPVSAPEEVVSVNDVVLEEEEENINDTPDEVSVSDDITDELIDEQSEQAENLDDTVVATSSAQDTATSTTETEATQETVSDVITSAENQSAGQESDTAGSGAQTEEDTDSDFDNTTEIETETSPNSSSTNELLGESENIADGELISYVESDSHFAFTKDECTRIEDGSYYCHDSGAAAELDDSLIAAPDVDGDLEIFLIQKGVRHQITYNKVDDVSPFYDEYSQTIVWHRLVNDRYQIISFDIATGEETQLTDSNVNNMEPARHGEYTVWQRWVVNNWEVILFDGKNEKQITDSARHDIAPHVRGPLVIWNSQSNDGTQSLKTYDIQNRTYTTIEDTDGVSVANPRMVVMYEAMYENGDIITKGFDLVSGKIVPLQSLPRELPEELPDTDSTGETRALIQHKPETRETEVDDSTDNTVGNTGTTTPELPDGTLDLSRSTSTESEILEFEESSEVVDIPDLIIEPTEELEVQATSTQS